jgi:hypothetical protein
VCFSNFKGSKSILVILVFPKYFDGFWVILIILEILGLFGFFFRFRDYFGHFGVSDLF